MLAARLAKLNRPVTENANDADNNSFVVSGLGACNSRCLELLANSSQQARIWCPLIGSDLFFEIP
jgi:hypothetical protein